MRITGRTRKRLALLLAAMVLSGGAVGSALVVRKANLSRSLDRALQEGAAAYQQGDHAAALRHLSAYTGRRKEAEAIFMLADSRRHVPQENNRHIPTAISFAKAAVDLDPALVPAHELLLELYSQSGFATEATATADLLLKLQPDHRAALEVKAFSNSRLGRHDAAIAAALDLVRSHPEDVSACRLAAELMQRGGRTTAQIRSFLEESASRAEHDIEFALLVADAALIDGDATEALSRVSRASELPITSGTQLAHLLRLLDTLARIDPQSAAMADGLLDREYPESIMGQVALLTAERAWKAGRADLAWQHIERSIRTSASSATSASLGEVPAGVLGWSILLQEVAQRSDRASENETISGASATSGETAVPPGAGSPGGTATSGGAAVPAISDRLAELRRRNLPEASFWLAIIDGNTAMEAGDLRLAAEHFQRAVLLDARSAFIAEFLLGHIDRRSGEWRRAQLRWEQLLRQHANWRTLRAAHAALLLDNGQYEDAMDSAQEAMRWSPARPEALLLSRAIMMQVESGQAEAARVTQILSLLESIADQAPGDGAIQTCAARAYLAAGRAGRAAAAIDRVLNPESLAPPSDLLLPLAYAVRQQDQSRAAQLLELAQQPGVGDRASPEALYVRALVLAEQGETGRATARELFEQQIQSAPPRERLAWQFRYAQFIGDPRGGGDAHGAVKMLASLAAEHSRNPEVQAALLDNDAAWNDEALISAAIQRLRDAAGADGASWRTHEARRLLTFEPSQSRAAQAIHTLAPFLSQGSMNEGAVARNPFALALAGEAYLLLGNRERAIDHFAWAVDLEPGRANYYPRLIEHLQSAGRAEDALRRLTAFSRIDALSDDFRRLRAQLSLSAGAWDLALADLTNLTAGRPLAPLSPVSPAEGSAAQPASTNLEDHFALAIVHLRRGNPALARPILEELARRPQASPAMLVAAADLRASGGPAGVEEGRKLIESAPVDIPPALRQNLLAAYLQRHGQLVNAEAVLAASAQEGDPGALAELARFYMDAGRFEESRAALDRGLAAAPNDSALRRVQALLRIQQGEDTPAAWNDLAGALASWTDAPPALRELTGIMQQRAARPDDKAGHITRLQTLTRQHPTFYIGWQILVQSLIEANDLPRASDAALAAMRSIPGDPSAAQLAATALIRQERYGEARAAAAQWRSRAAHDTFDADVLAAWLEQQTSRPQEGLRLLEPWRQRLVASGDPERLTLLAGLLIDANRVQDAARLLAETRSESRSALRVDSGSSRERTLNLSALTLTPRIRDNTVARGWLNDLQPLLASDPEGRIALGESWAQLLGRSRSPADLQSLSLLLQELTTDPQHGFSAHLILASANEALALNAEAERHYRSALALQSDNIIILNNLAYLLSQAKPEGGSALHAGSEGSPSPSPQARSRSLEAVSLATRAVTLARQQSMPPPVLRAILDTQGVALLNTQQWSEAEGAFREALRIEPDAADLLIGLAEARFGQGDAEEAKALLQTARTAITPAAPLAPTRAARLAALEARLP